MPLVLTCPTCRHPLTVDEASAGTTVACPTCRAPLAVPAAAVPVAPADPFEPPAEEPRRSRRPTKGGGMPVWAVGALVLLTGGIVAAVVLSRGGQQPVAKDEKKDKEKVEPKSLAKSSVAEGRAKKVRDDDAKVMAHFRAGQKDKGLNVLVGILDSYKDRDPTDCTPDEARTVATAYMRYAALAGPQLDEKTRTTFALAFEIYAVKAGLKPLERDILGSRIIKETRDAYNQR